VEKGKMLKRNDEEIKKIKDKYWKGTVAMGLWAMLAIFLVNIFMR
jgi:hypothetical protein